MQLIPYAHSIPFLNHKSRDASLAWITFFVIGLHTFGIWISFFLSEPTLPKEIRQKVIVKTVQLNPLKEIRLLDPPAIQPNTVIARVEDPSPFFAQPMPELVLKSNEVPSPKPEEKKESSLPTPKLEKKIEMKKNETLPKKEIKPLQEKSTAKPKTEKKPSPKKELSPTKKTAEVKKPVTPAPVKKASQESVKPKTEVKKGPTPEEIAAKEAEKAKQKQQEAAREAEKAKQKEIEIAKEMARVQQQELLIKAKEKIAKIGETRDKIGANKISSLDDTTIPKQLANLQIDALAVGTGVSVELGAREISYRDEVAYRIKTALRLPDNNEVKLKLILNRNGRVASVHVIASGSAKNKEYIDKTVPTLIFPDFGNRFRDAAQSTFLITLNKDQ